MEEEDPKKIESETPGLSTKPTQEDHVIVKTKEEEKTQDDISYKEKIVNPLLEEKAAPVLLVHQSTPLLLSFQLSHFFFFNFPSNFEY